MKTLVIDGGTTNLRVYLLDASGQVLSCARAEGGVRHTAIDGHNGRLRELLRGCIRQALEESGTAADEIGRAVAYGMITSGMGLLEIPHLVAPVTAGMLRCGMQSAAFPDIAPFAIEFIPGVRNFGGEVHAGNCADMDMMRGEETESIGLHRLLSPRKEALFVLPGSHNKFVHMGADGEILGCMTSISGELLDAVTHHTILSGAVGGGFCSPETYDADMACAGAAECLRSGLGRAAFAGRILNTLGAQDAPKIQSWLLGAVLCEDVKALRTFVKGAAPAVYVAGKPPLQQAFIDVLRAMGIKGARSVDPALTARMGVTGALEIAGI
ncbi:MAG: 2-dehydro-3-deoxygalactonokinase [Clostridia bacterium]|nr:2-dehydro-3-deoxygalactonokinase [Clostridia bacterium]